MIKFFRKIRQRLLTENKFSKYLLYAIGEITLVMIGILLALQVNNWNENRKSKIMANEVYFNLLTSLKQDSIEVKRTIYSLDKSLEKQRKLIVNGSNRFPNELNDQDTLDKMLGEIVLGVMSFFPKTGVYDLVTSNNGMDLLKSNEIKSLLINLYDFQYKRYETLDATIDIKYHNHLGPVIRKKIGFIGEFNSDSEFTIMNHVDPILFHQHYPELVAECRDIYGMLSTGKNNLKLISTSINELIKLINNELKKNES